jgi:ABC-type Fe3+-hydroxamate transport system substrate-binding protein
MTLDELSEKTATLARPRLLLLSALDPPTSAGALAATIAPAGGTAAPWDSAAASALTPEQIAAFAPEVLIVAGDDLDAAEEALEEDPFWSSLPCAAAGDCYVADAKILAEEPRVLATILHPEVFTELVPAFSVRIVNLG